MSDRFVIEANRKVVGIAVRTRGGFRFFSSEPAYHGLEGRVFARVAQLARRVAEVEKAQAVNTSRPPGRLH